MQENIDKTETKKGTISLNSFLPHNQHMGRSHRFRGFNNQFVRQNHKKSEYIPGAPGHLKAFRVGGQRSHRARIEKIKHFVNIDTMPLSNGTGYLINDESPVSDSSQSNQHKSKNTIQLVQKPPNIQMNAQLKQYLSNQLSINTHPVVSSDEIQFKKHNNPIVTKALPDPSISEQDDAWIQSPGNEIDITLEKLIKQTNLYPSFVSESQLYLFSPQEIFMYFNSKKAWISFKTTSNVFYFHSVDVFEYISSFSFSKKLDSVLKQLITNPIRTFTHQNLLHYFSPDDIKILQKCRFIHSSHGFHVFSLQLPVIQNYERELNLSEKKITQWLKKQSVLGVNSVKFLQKSFHSKFQTEYLFQHFCGKQIICVKSGHVRLFEKNQ